MHRFIALPLALVLGMPAAAQEKKAAPDARARAVAPFLGELTVAVVYGDLARIDLEALVDRLGKLAKLDKEMLAQARREAGSSLKALRDAGVRDLYGVVSLEGFPDSPQAFLVVPLSRDANAPAAAKVLKQMLHRPSARIGDALVVGDAAVLGRLKNLKPTALPELNAAFAAAGTGPVQLIVWTPKPLRRALEEMLPDLPQELGGGSIRVITQGLSWVGVGLRLEPKLSIQVTVQARDAAAARDLALLHDRMLRGFTQLLAQDRSIQELLPNVGALRELLTPKVTENRLTLALNEKDLTSLLVPLLVRAREASLRGQSINNLKQLALAMHNYHSTYKSFPPHASYDKQGRPLLSWRVHLLPYLEQEVLYKEFHLNEPWDSGHNKKLIARMPALFRDPASQAAAGKTTYVVPVGKATIFPPGPKGVPIRDVTDGTSNTLLIVEVDNGHAVDWTRPEDLSYNPRQPLQGLGGKGQDRFLAAFGDGSVRSISRKIDLDTLRALFTRNGGEVVGDIP